MRKHLTLQIDEPIDLRLRIYAAHLGETKAAAASRALAAGIPAWVTPSAPGVDERDKTTGNGAPDQDAADETSSMFDAGEEMP